MNDYKDMLLKAMTQGVSLEDVMKDISDAATAIEKERKEAAERQDKYLKYTKPIGEVYPEHILTSGLFARKQIFAEDAALVLAHYVCQNVPGYAEFAAENDVDLIKTYTSIVKNQATVAKSMVAHKDDGEDAPLNALIDSFADMLSEAIFGDAPSHEKIVNKPTASTSFAPVTLSKSDQEKVQEFMRKMRLD